MVQPADIPVVILCGGMGTRLREASEKLPKPLVDIGGRPILWHVMKLYSAHGFRRFILCLGYKGDQIKRYFLDYHEYVSDFTLHMADQRRDYHSTEVEDWEITFAETGLLTGTGGRLRRVLPYLDTATFLMTYGDGIGNVDVKAVLDTHLQQGRTGTVTAVHPSSRYGEMQVDVEASQVVEFNEKPTTATGFVSGGFFAFQRSFVENYFTDEPGLMLEHSPLQRLAADGQLSVRPHEGFWLGMDTYRDWTLLNTMWDNGNAPWRIWKDETTA